MISPLFFLGAGFAAAQLVDYLRGQERAYSGAGDLLPWSSLLEDDILLLKNGGLAAVWRLTGPDLATALPSELEALTTTLTTAFAIDGATIHVTYIKRPALGYAPSAFPANAAARLIDAERAASLPSLFETETLLTIALPPRGAARAATIIRAELDHFTHTVATLEARLAAAVHLDRLRGGALLARLHECVTGDHHRLGCHDLPLIDLDAYLATQDVVGGDEPRVGSRALSVLALTGYPVETPAAALGWLQSVPAAFRFSTRLIILNPTETRAAIAARRTAYARATESPLQAILDRMNPEDKNTARRERARHLAEDDAALSAAFEAKDALKAAGSGQRYAYVTAVAIVTDEIPERVRETSNLLTREFQRHGLAVRREHTNALAAWQSALPAQSTANRRRPLLPLDAAVALVPATSVWTGPETVPSNLYPSQSPPLLWTHSNGNPFRLSHHAGDVGHTLLVGQTGAGKSVLATLLAAQHLRYEDDPQVFFFDLDRSSYTLCRALAGAYFEPGADDAPPLQPLRHIDTDAEQAFALDWLEALFLASTKTALTPTFRRSVANALQLLRHQPQPERTLSKLALLLNVQDLRTALQPYTEGPYSRLLNGSTGDLDLTNFVTIETRSVTDLGDACVIPVLLTLFRAVERRLDGRPTLIILDEAWKALANPLFAARIQNWLRTLRKRNASVFLITQHPGDITSNPAGAALLASLPTRIFTANPNGADLHAYRALGLREGEISAICAATPKRDFYLRTPTRGRMFELTLGPVQRALLTARPAMTLAETHRLLDQHMSRGGDWLASWLTEEP